VDCPKVEVQVGFSLWAKKEEAENLHFAFKPLPMAEPKAKLQSLNFFFEIVLW
jgi:hypothetical protein